MSKYHTGWQTIFNTLPIVRDVQNIGHFDITADQIKAISAQEPRLMAKFDFRESLPPVMASNNLAMLAINNGIYRIAQMDPFISIKRESLVAPLSVPFPQHILTITPGKLAHEAVALDAAKVSGILAMVFGEDVDLTIRGRTFSPRFSFNIGQTTFPVSSVQIEVDGGYEGVSTVNLVEAKIGGRGNINIRQLLYPQRAWEQTLNQRKAVRTFICFYQEPVLRFIPVLFQNGVCSADHANEKTFLLEAVAQLDLMAIVENAGAAIPVMGVPFPQADNFDTVLAMLGILANAADQSMSTDDLLDEFDIVSRQIHYYGSVLRWLGLAEVERGQIRLTSYGKEVASMPHADKIRQLATTIFREPFFHFALRHRDETAPSNLFTRWKLTGSTQGRRMQTVRAWLRYFERLVGI